MNNYDNNNIEKQIVEQENVGNTNDGELVFYIPLSSGSSLNAISSMFRWDIINVAFPHLTEEELKSAKADMSMAIRVYTDNKKFRVQMSDDKVDKTFSSSKGNEKEEPEV